ncbi:MAG: sodium/solute symporter [Candidatus Brocadiae bacterium]|nr:sodium/solute symporter [Candidatus Brocadiia bacterium]
MAAVDYAVMVLFFVLLFGVSAWASRRRASKEQFFMAGHALTWPFIGFALIAINVGARYVIGFAGVGFRYGVLFGQYEVVSTLNLVVLVFILLPLYRASGIYTMPQLLRQRFGDSTHLIYSIVAILAIFLTVPAGTCLLSKTLAQVARAGQVGGPEAGAATLAGNMWSYVAIIIPVCVLLQMWGGLRSVAYTDMIMGIVILVGGVVVTHAAVTHEAVGGWAGLAQKIRATKPELLYAFREGGPIPWQAVFSGVFMIGLWFWCIDQTRMQMVLASRTLNDGRRGALLCALLKYVTAVLVLAPGLCGRLIYPDLPEAKADTVFGKLLADLIGPGLLGLVVAGLAAAAISTLMSLLNAAATIFTNDVMKRVVSEETFERRAILFSRIFVLVAGGLTFAGVAWYAQAGAVMTVLLKVYGLVAGPTLAVYLLGIFWRRANAQGAVPALLIGMVFSFGAELTPQLGWINHHYRALIAFGLSSAILVVVSVFTAAPDPSRLERTTFAWYLSRRKELEALAATPADHEGEPLRDPWYLDWRLWSACLVALLLATWWLFGLGRVLTGFG